MLVSFVSFILLGIFSKVAAECPNACSGYGSCNAYDTCTCDARHMGNDCSQRVCPFGLAHSDIAKGDIDGDGMVSNADVIVGYNGERFRYGTTEGYPSARDSNDNVLTNTAHELSECSSKGVCDRATGTCQCYPAYDGAACQRASCPGYPADTCSGHGVCKTIKQLAMADYMNMYELWDEDTTMGCECDSGYYGADCSLRKCKSGVDPLYEDDVSQRKTVKYFVGIFSENITNAGNDIFDDGTTAHGAAKYRYVFTDQYGKEWETGNLPNWATCAQVITAFQNIPEDTLPVGSVRCSHIHLTNQTLKLLGNYSSGDVGSAAFEDAMNGNLISISAMAAQFVRVGAGLNTREQIMHQSAYNAANWYDMDLNQHISGDAYHISITGIGRLEPIKINKYLDEDADATLWANDFESRDDAEAPRIVIFSDGSLAESKDFFGDYCSGVAVQIKNTMDNSEQPRLVIEGGGSGTQAGILKACLGDSDGYPTNNVGLQNWDLGSEGFPHMIKITKVFKNDDDDSDYLVISYDSSSGYFNLLNPFVVRDKYETTRDLAFAQSNDYFNVHTTKGTLKLISSKSQVIANPGSNVIYTVNASYDLTLGATGLDTDEGPSNFNGDVSCENLVASGTAAGAGSNVHGSGFKADDATTLATSGGTTFTSCVEKGDWLVLLSSRMSNWMYNPKYINMYKVERLQEADGYLNVDDRYGRPTAYGSRYSQYEGDDARSFDGNETSAFMQNSIILDQAANFWRTGRDDDIGGATVTREVNVYKFFSHAESTYDVVSECSNRGLCDTDSGICKCFPGYEGDSCNVQSITSC